LIEIARRTPRKSLSTERFRDAAHEWRVPALAGPPRALVQILGQVIGVRSSPLRLHQASSLNLVPWARMEGRTPFARFFQET
jgi:hypothetical protein